MQLAHHHAFRTVDDELTTPEHDRNVAEIDFLFHRLLACQPQPDAQGAAVCQAELATFVRVVAGLAQLVADILQLDGLVVTLDRENLAQNPLDPLILTFVGRNIVLEKAIIKPSLDFREIGDGMAGAPAAEVANLGGLEAADGASCHR